MRLAASPQRRSEYLQIAILRGGWIHAIVIGAIIATVIYPQRDRRDRRPH